MRSQVALALLVLAASGCTSADQDDAVAAADGFVTAVDRHDGKAACAVLAPATVSELEQSTKKPCEQAVLEEARPASPRVDAKTYATMAQVRYRDDVLFVTRFGSTWKVMAAACTKKTGDPYDCDIQGR
jgi:hypothetical protein